MPYEEGGKKQYDNTNRGVMFKNDRKEKPTQQDFKGWGETDCPYCQAKIELWLGAWVKESQKDGKLFMSCSLEPKVQAAARNEGKVQSKLDADDLLRSVTNVLGEKNAPQGAGQNPPPTRRVSGADPTGIDSLPSTMPGTEDFDDVIPFAFAFLAPLAAVIAGIVMYGQGVIV